MNTNVYWVEALEQGAVKIVPHDTKHRYFEFIARTEANKYLKGLVAVNPHLQFRLCKKTTSKTAGPWIKYIKPVFKTHKNNNYVTPKGK